MAQSRQEQTSCLCRMSRSGFSVSCNALLLFCMQDVLKTWVCITRHGHVLTRVSLTSDSLGTYAFCLICWIDTVSRSGRGIAASTASECSSSGIVMARFSSQVQIGLTSGSYPYNTGGISPPQQRCNQSLSGHPLSRSTGASFSLTGSYRAQLEETLAITWLT